MAPKMVSLRNSYKARPSTGTSYVQILGTGMDTGDTSPSVLLFFDNKRFLFNAGEGMQRFCVEHKIKLSKIDHVLFTRVCSETTGGLPGMLLTLAGEVGLTVNIWGPTSLQTYLSAISTFLPNSSMLHAHAFGPSLEGGVVLNEDIVRISSVFLQPTDFKDHHERNIAVAYVCQLPEVKGRFDPAKAAALGLKPGRKYGQLQDGMAVESDDGQRTIHPSEVMEPPSPGPVFVLVDCPTVSHISALTSAPSFRKLYTSDSSKPACIVHISPLSVTEDARYRTWMSKFGDVQHILAGPGYCRNSMTSPVFESSIRLLAKLNLICPQIFPIQLGTDTDGALSTTESNVCAAGRNLLKFHLRPLSVLGLDESLTPQKFSLEAAQAELASETPELLHLKEQIAAFANEKFMDDIPSCIRGKSDEMEVIFLGTGSSHPCKHRNVSSIYLHLFKRGGILLDCGEGTYGQLKQRYGNEGADIVLANLKCIWISHIHADHQCGLPRLLTARRSVLNKLEKPVEPILVIGPKFLRRFLAAYQLVEDLSMDFLDCSQTSMDATNVMNTDTPSECVTGKRKHSAEPGDHLITGLDEVGRDRLRKLLMDMELKSLVSVPVIHCAHSFGAVIEAASGWKFAYSGDTRPCNAFVEASKGATIFIHEATFEDGLMEEAVYKNHSLTREAVKAGAEAGAYRILLTHFSQRYPKIPVLDESYNERTCVAFDMMSVNLVDLPWLPKLVPAFKLLFKDITEDGTLDQP